LAAAKMNRGETLTSGCGQALEEKSFFSKKKKLKNYISLKGAPLELALFVYTSGI
jgi:hypothetical protein